MKAEVAESLARTQTLWVRMLGRLLGLILVTVSLPASAAASWAPPVVLSGSGWGGSVAMNGQGGTLAAWLTAAPPEGGGRGISVSVRSPGSAWSAPSEIYSGRLEWSPSVAVGGDGSMYVAWKGEGGAYVAVAEPGGGFAQPMLLSAAGAGVQVAADDHGDAVVVWVEGAGGDLMAIARAAGEPFSPPQKVATGVQDPQLAVSRASGEAWLAWIQSEQDAMPRTFLATRPSRGSFSAGAPVPGNVATEEPRSPRVAATATGAALVSWAGTDRGGASRIRATRIRDGSAPVMSEVATGGGTYFAGLSDAGRGVLAFGGGSSPVMGAVTPADGSFGQAQSVFPSASGEANGAAVDNAGNALVFWAASGIGNVSVSPAGAADAFCSPVAIVPNGYAGPVSMAFDAGGNGVAVFQRNASSEVLAVDYRQESGCPSPPVVAPVAVKRALVRVGSRVVVSRSGHSVRMTLACRAGMACSGSVVLMGRSGRSAQPAVTLGRRSFSIAAGTNRTLRMSLSRRAVRMLRGHQRVRATATVRLRGQAPVRRAVVLAS